MRLMQHTVSSLERYPLVRVSFIERFHCIDRHVCMSYRQLGMYVVVRA